MGTLLQASETQTPRTPPILQGLRTPEIVKAKPKLLDKEGSGRLYRVGKLLVCVMQGTHEQMGYQHGRLLAKQTEHIMKQGYVKKALWDRGYTREYTNEQSRRMEKHFPPEYIEEMKGLVKGLHDGGFLDATYEDVRLGVTEAELLHFDPDSPPGCSNFAIWGKWTSDGRLLHGRNLDWDTESGAQVDAVILVWRPTGGIPFMMVGWSGGIGSVSGMNARGITFGEMTLPSPDATFDGLPMFLFMRRVLETSQDLNQALDLIQTTPRTTGWNYILGHGEIRDGRALETDAAHCDVFAPMDPQETDKTGHWAMEDAVRRTNHPVSERRLLRLLEAYGELAKQELGMEVKGLEDGIPLLKLQNSWQRYDWMGRIIQAQEGKVDIKECLQVLANGPVAAGNTLHSWVFDPENQVAYVANAGFDPPVTAHKMPFYRIDLKKWFKE